mgnify:CR=1 FL=1
MTLSREKKLQQLLDKIKKDDWTSCPKCGTDLMMKDLPTHLNSVHHKLSKTKDGREQKLKKR